jgi:hypothetical protein
MSFGKARSEVLALRGGSVHFIQSIIKREIVPWKCTHNQDGFLHGIEFFKEDVLRYLKKRRSQLGKEFATRTNIRWKERPGTIYLKRAATALGVMVDTIYFLRTQGAIEIIEGAHRGASLTAFISDESARQFRSRFVSSGALAREVGTSSNKILTLLRTHAVRPAFGPDLDGCPQYIFERSSIERVGSLSELLTSERIRAIERDPRVRLTELEVADLLGVPMERIQRLVESGLLKQFKPRLHSSASVFNGYGVIRYRKMFGRRDDLVSGPVAAHMLGMKVGYLQYWVRTGRLNPVPLLNRNRLNYYKRDEVETFAQSRSADF